MDLPNHIRRILVIWPLRAALGVTIAPVYLFVLTLGSFAFLPPDLAALPLDRILLAVLVLVSSWHLFLTRTRLVIDPLLGPYGVLAALALAGTAMGPFDSQAWSLTAAKYVVPLVMFVIARNVLADSPACARFFQFANALLVYLILIALLHLAHLEVLIFPKFILDASLGLHADRARGPFLQAVANGTALTILGLMAWDWWQRRHFRGVLPAVVALLLPIAVLATLTRAVWLSFVVAVAVMVLFSANARARRVAWIGLVLGMGPLVIALSSAALRQTVFERTDERGPVEVRLAAYRSALEMYRERPLLGWGANQSAKLLANYVSEYSLGEVTAHNTCLEVLLEYGSVGLVLYVGSLALLWRIGARLPRPGRDPATGTVDSRFTLVWRTILIVYVLNGLSVVMNYQFVNALVFSLGGMTRGLEDRARGTGCDKGR